MVNSHLPFSPSVLWFLAVMSVTALVWRQTRGEEVTNSYLNKHRTSSNRVLGKNVKLKRKPFSQEIRRVKRTFN